MSTLRRRLIVVFSSLALVAGGGATAVAASAQGRAAWTDTVVQNSEFTTLPNSSAVRTVAILYLPKGKYVLTANLSLYRGVAAVLEGSCWIGVGEKILPKQAVYFSIATPSNYGDVSMAGGVSVGSGGATAKVRCSVYESSQYAQVLSATLVAHRTNSIGVITG